MFQSYLNIIMRCYSSKIAPTVEVCQDDCNSTTTTSFSDNFYDNYTSISFCSDENIKKLMFAILDKNIDAINSVIDTTVDLNSWDIDKQNVLYYSIRAGLEDVTKRLHQKGVNIHNVSKHGETVLHVACEMQLMDLVQYFVSHGVDHHQRDKCDNLARSRLRTVEDQCKFDLCVFTEQQKVQVVVPTLKRRWSPTGSAFSRYIK